MAHGAESRWWRARPEHRLSVLQTALEQACADAGGRMARYERAHRNATLRQTL